MDVVRLDSAYRVDTLIEGWSSMIWTERYSGLGEFSMTTPLISESRELIPEGTFISLLDSDEVMQVDTHSIEREESGGVLNKISGSTFPIVTGERDTVGLGVNTTLFPANWEMRQYYTPAEAVGALIWDHLIDNQYKFTGPEKDLNEDPIARAGDPRLLIPNLEIIFSDIQFWVDPNPDVANPAPAGKRKWVLDRSSLDGPIFDILTQGKLGLRMERPRRSGVPQAVLYTPGGEAYLDPVVVSEEASRSRLRFNIYQGRDLSNNVTFRYDAGQIEKPTYLYSIRGYKNVAHVSSAHRDMVVTAPGVDPNVSGLNRRVLYFDAGDLSDLDLDGTFTDDDWGRILTQKALTELEKYNKVALFDGEISPLANVKYGRDYSLGDKVTLQAEYGFVSQMTISEYIRSQDEGGETGYPTLTFVD